MNAQAFKNLKAATLDLDGSPLPDFAATSVMCGDLTALLAHVSQDENGQPCQVCKGTRVAYETGLFWSEAHPCTACAPTHLEPAPDPLGLAVYTWLAQMAEAVEDAIDKTASRLGCSREIACQIITGKLEARQ